MAAPSYTEDLTDIDLAESTTGWAALGGGGAGLSASPDLSMQGTNCVDKQITNAEKGQVFDNGSGITMGTGDHVFVWLFVGTPGLADTLVNRGTVVIVGSSTSNYCKYHVEGSNTYGAGGRVGKCYIVDPTVYTSNTGSIPYRTVVGTHGGTYQVFGGMCNMTASVKGANLGVDALRYGTGGYLTAGELISAGDASDNPCTFSGFATQSDSSTNRWGILTDIGGNFELQGTFAIGQNNSQVATLARFEDTDVNIAIVNTVHSATDFTKFIIDHASTVCNWNNVSLQALGTNNPGQILVQSNNPTFNVTGGTWSAVGITTLRSNSTIDGLTWKGCGKITQNGSTIQNCTIDGTSDAAEGVLSDNPGLITDCTFISDGSGHAVRCDTTGTYNWDGNFDSGYTGTRGTNNTPASGSTDAMFYNNSGGLITLNVIGGGQKPSVRNGAGATTVVNASFTLTLTDVPSGVQVTIVNSSTRTELQNSTSTGVDITYTHGGGETVDILFMSNDYDPNGSDVYDLTLPNSDSSIKVALADDLNYENP